MAHSEHFLFFLLDCTDYESVVLLSLMFGFRFSKEEPNHPLLLKDPQITNVDLKEQAKGPCGPQCFSSMDDDGLVGSSVFTVFSGACSNGC